MDETIAQLYNMYYFIESFKTELKTELKKAYKKFVKNILKEETSNKPLGILRPGILNVMSKLYELHKKGKIKGVIIYSNNGHLESLEFIRDLINKHVGNKLIKECIHWDHPLRGRYKTNKTWKDLHNILMNGMYKDKNVNKDHVYFFDDLCHTDLMENLTHYYKVPAYNFKVSFDRISDIYAISNIKELTNTEKSHIIKVCKSKIKGTSDNPPLQDKGIDIMMNVIDNLKKVKNQT